MIEKNEILSIARSLGLSPDTVEKDYVLGWMLYGISKHSTTKKWVFKGGTSLKKCFFNTFRFSEDLDYTLMDSKDINVELLIGVFSEITEFINEEVGIDFFQDKFKFKIIDKGNGNYSAQGKIHYNGPLRRERKVATIKLDLTTDEVIVLDAVSQKVSHPYSDAIEEGIFANCYAFEEVVAEKIRALAQRIRPRDLYDVVHFFRNRAMIKNPKLVYTTLEKKCQYKNIEVPTFSHIEQHDKLDELEPQWENMLAHQLPSLPPIKSFWDDLQPFFDWLVGQLKEECLFVDKNVIGDIWNIKEPQKAFSTQTWLSKIQFSAANRVCVKLSYNSKIRVVEPLSFRINTNTGNKIFYGFERDAGCVKAYSISKIESIEVTTLPYVEKYPVEISSTGFISMPPIRKNAK